MPVPCTVMCGRDVAFRMFGSAFVLQPALSRSCALKTESWSCASWIVEVPKSPTKQTSPLGQPAEARKLLVSGIAEARPAATLPMSSRTPFV